jgi:CO/xanthine dehydrogenase Mo-binding subunit
MYPLRSAIAFTLGLELVNVRCVHMEASGCYGHNGADDAACDAAALAMALPGRPVRLQWERRDEFLWEPLGPAMQIEAQAALDDSGRISNWQYDLWSCPHASRPRSNESAGYLIYAKHKAFPLPEPPPFSIPQPSGGSDRNSVPLYAIENMRVNKHFVTDIPIRGSSLRGLGAYGNVFAIESFMDELAGKSGSDPFEFRARHLEDPRALEVLSRLKEAVRWGERPKPATGTGWGLAFARFKNLSSYLGIVMQLHVDTKTKGIRLIKATAVCDAGLVVNPDGLKAQIEGGIIQSSSWTLTEQVEFSTRTRKSHDWNSYPILRFDEVPEVDIILIDRPDEKSLGVGETAQGPTAAAIANGIFHATGKRLRQLPFTPDRFG